MESEADRTPAGRKLIDVPEAPPPRTLQRGDWWKVALWLSLTVILLAGHYMTPVRPETMPLHNIHRLLFYFPIMLAAFWSGTWGGLVAGGVIFMFYLPHVYGGGGGHDAHGAALVQEWTSLNHLLEGTVYLLIGGLTGRLIDRLRTEEARLKHALERLRISARELFDSEERLRRADRLTALGQLTTGLAHEIRNPLGSIRGAAEILGDPDIPDDRRREFAAVLVEETERLDAVLTNFLEYARTQREHDGGPADLRAVLDRLLTLMNKKLQSVGVRVVVDLPADPPRVAIGEALLQQVLLNIVLNAVQAMEKGGTLRIEARRTDGAAAGEVRRVTIAVTDTGPGIPSAIRRRVFDPFFTTRAGGTGLGLSIVHRIVTGQGGDVAIEDGPDAAGTRVVVTLPEA